MARLTLIVAQVFMSVGGLLLHLRIHHFDLAAGFSGTFFMPTAVGIFDVVVITALLCSKRTVALGFLLNGMACILGVIFMSAFALHHPPAGTGVLPWITSSMFPDISIVVADFFVVRGVWLVA